MSEPANGIAIVGMAGRFPGARDVDQFWTNIKSGVESITRFSPESLELPPPNDGDDVDRLVCAKGMLDDVDMFDARFFDYLPKEAEVMDPQHRVFLEICWEAMERGGYDPSRYPGAVGVFGGCYMDTYVLNNLCSNEAFRRKLIESIQVGSLQTEIGNDKDYLATRVAYKLGLRGPAMTLQTACSTSLVAVATACQSIDSYQCDMALAGGVTIVLPQHKGYFYKEGGMLSPDGRCRPFDENAAGTVFSNGAAVLLLKRAEDAVRDGDTIYAVIRGYATNNDGGEKLSYTAPSVDGQAEVISLALGMGGVDARSIGYVEAHGTATPLGDPIEVAGLTTAYRRDTDDKQFCALGSVKANLGHLDCASGAIGLIKTSLALKEKLLPPLLHFKAPNSKIDFENSPFFINTNLQHWEADGPRRAGVSSFGVGGTNAHVVVEEAPEFESDPAKRADELIILSARSPAALENQAARLAAHLEMHPDTDIADAAHTLRVGRKAFEHRRFVTTSGKDDAIAKLQAPARPGESGIAEASRPDVIFMFPGQGAQYPGMGRDLYYGDAVFRDTVDRIADALAADNNYGRDIREFLLWDETAKASKAEMAQAIAQTVNAQPSLYAVECGLGALMAHWGVTPVGVIGHSVGEFAAAATAGVFSYEDGARLVAARATAMQAQPAGAMLAVMQDGDDLRNLLPQGICIAAVNAPGTCVVSGNGDAIADFARTLKEKEIAATPLKTSHAFHSPMMAGAEETLVKAAASLTMKPTDVAFFSTLTGAETNADAMTGADYWGAEMMHPVLFCDALRAAGNAHDTALFIELGPGRALTGFTRRIFGPSSKAFTAMDGDGVAGFLGAIGRLWVNGVSPNWDAALVGCRRRVPLPTYAFERKRFWVEPTVNAGAGAGVAVERQSINDDMRSSGGVASGGVEDLIEQQLDVIAEQIALLKAV